ncbi:hypothetical protein F5Y10DRAFT_260910 [Nemania abortiva]|nr:hypothetical protein F5Y10DRAFT_260910 [Nemania abortiva]
MAALPRPLSPWAKRFGHNVSYRPEVLPGPEIHSGIAPLAPRLNPKYYAETPPIEPGPLTDKELDSLFLSEKIQREYQMGLYTWQAGPLMRYVRFSDKTGLISGGHMSADAVEQGAVPRLTLPMDLSHQIFLSERIQVDDSKWFDFLRSDRWYDKGLLNDEVDDENWSISNPDVWRHLSVTMELLDRMVKALIADRHQMMETVLYGVIFPWSHMPGKAGQPEPYKGCKYIVSRQWLQTNYFDQTGQPNNWDFIGEFTSDDWTARLEYLMRDATLAFIERFFSENATWGVTFSQYDGMICLDVGGYRRLRSPDITLAERCLLHHTTALVLLHEIFHSITVARRQETGWPKDVMPINYLPDAKLTSEPWRVCGKQIVEDDGVAEMGHAADKRIIGGSAMMATVNTDGMPIGSIIYEHPKPWIQAPEYRGVNVGNVIPDNAAFQAGRMFHIYQVPALYTSKLLSQEFWDDPATPRKSDNFFHNNRIINSDTLWEGELAGWDHKIAEISTNLPAQLDPGEKEVMEVWEERRRDWEQRRAGWYDDAKIIWDMTPWSKIKARQTIIRFQKAFAQKDEIICRDLGMVLVYQMPWNSDRDHFIEFLPPYNQNHRWIFYCIGLLALASIPISDKEMETPREVMTYKFKPCVWAPNLQDVELSARLAPNDIKVDKSAIFDPLGRPGKDDIENFDHHDYLQLISSTIQAVESLGDGIPAPWLVEIAKALDSIRRQRLDRPQKNTWLDEWPFEIPEYNPYDILMYENGNWVAK